MLADPGILKRIRRCPFARGGRVTVRFCANGSSLYSRRSNLPLARLRLTGEADEGVVLYPSHRGGWQPPGDFGTIAMPSTRPSKPSAPIHTSCNCARTSIELIRSARSSHPGTRLPVNFSQSSNNIKSYNHVTRGVLSY
jgi:hypothetical protein